MANTVTHVTFLSDMIPVHIKYKGSFLLDFSCYESLCRSELERIIESQSDIYPELQSLAESKKYSYREEYDKVYQLKKQLQHRIRALEYVYKYDSEVPHLESDLEQLQKIDIDSC